jgi:N utilization substance protein B
MTDEKKNHRRHGSRYKARRRAVDMLFEAEFRDIDPVEIVEDRVELSRDPANQVNPVPAYTGDIVRGVADGLDSIDDAIARHLSSEWTLDRLPAVDRAVLRVSAWELLDNDDVPVKVAVSEGIGLAGEYSHDKAPGYVNAVLDGIARDKVLADREAADAERAAQAEQAEQDAAAAADDQASARAESEARTEDIIDGVLGGAAEQAEQAEQAQDGGTVTD